MSRLFKDFVLARSLAEARDALRSLGADGVPVAGGSSFLFVRNKEPKVAVDLSRAGMAGIRIDGNGFDVGAMTTIDALRRFQDPGWALDRVAARFVTQQMRNMTTLGGNITRVFAWNDFPVALLALGATMLMASETPRAFTADEFFKGQPSRLLGVGDLLATIQVPALGENESFGYYKHVRVAADFSQATAAVWIRVEHGEIQAARVGLGAAIAMPTRLVEVETALHGRRIESGLAREAAERLAPRAFRPVAGFSQDYIAHVAKIAIADALDDAFIHLAETRMAQRGRKINSENRGRIPPGACCER